MPDEFSTKLETLIDEHMKAGGDIAEILSDLELKVQALRDEIAEL